MAKRLLGKSALSWRRLDARILGNQRRGLYLDQRRMVSEEQHSGLGVAKQPVRLFWAPGIFTATLRRKKHICSHQR